MGDPWGTVFWGGGGLERANKNKIGPKTSKSTKKIGKSDFVSDRKMSKYIG